MRWLWKLTLLLFCTRLQYHVLISKQIISYFTLVTSWGKVTTIIPWWTETMFPPLLLDPKMVKIFFRSHTQNKTKEGMGTLRTYLKNSETQASSWGLHPAGQTKQGLQKVPLERGAGLTHGGHNVSVTNAEIHHWYSEEPQCIQDSHMWLLGLTRDHSWSCLARAAARCQAG